MSLEGSEEVAQRAAHAVAENPEAAMTAVLQADGPRLLAAVRRLLSDDSDARDAFQEGMLAAWKSLANFKGRASLSTWVHRIVVNHALMRLRQRGHRVEQSLDALLPEFTDYGHHTKSPECWQVETQDLLVQAETRAIVHDAIAKLPDTHRLPLLLRDIEGIELAEVARMLDVSPNVVKVRAHRGRQALKALLEPSLSRGQL